MQALQAFGVRCQCAALLCSINRVRMQRQRVDADDGDDVDSQEPRNDGAQGVQFGATYRLLADDAAEGGRGYDEDDQDAARLAAAERAEADADEGRAGHFELGASAPRLICELVVLAAAACASAETRFD
jgi:hypothetical protein